MKSLLGSTVSNITCVALEITNTKAVEERLLSHGNAITEKVELEGAKLFFIRDPDENVIEFHKPARWK
jgi:lactoylglutathione lyase